jgi:hypothetical protein
MRARLKGCAYRYPDDSETSIESSDFAASLEARRALMSFHRASRAAAVAILAGSLDILAGRPDSLAYDTLLPPSPMRLDLCQEHLGLGV